VVVDGISIAVQAVGPVRVTVVVLQVQKQGRDENVEGALYLPNVDSSSTSNQRRP
jgi:hypothetical protein